MTNWAHKIWAASLFADGVQQKAMRICQEGAPQDVMLTLYNAASGLSSAEPAGWSIEVTFKASPDTVLFSRSFPTEKEAQDAYKDLVNATAEVEGLLRQEKFEEAAEATAALLKKYSANSTNPPTDVSEV